MADPVTLAALAETAAAAAPAAAETAAVALPAAETVAASSAIPGLVSSAAPELAGNSMTASMLNGMNFPLNPTIGQSMASAAEPSYWDQFTKFTQQNPVLTQIGFQTGEKMLTPQQIHASPAMISQGRTAAQPVDWASAMNPYKQTMQQNKPISLI